VNSIGPSAITIETAISIFVIAKSPIPSARRTHAGKLGLDIVRPDLHLKALYPVFLPQATASVNVQMLLLSRSTIPLDTDSRYKE
jgi:hypothetical protein